MSSKVTITPLALRTIRIDGGTQSRSRLNQDAMLDFAAAMKAGVEFPPLVCFFDGSDHWLADGFHRYFAYLENKIKTASVRIINGTVRDAILYAVSANLENKAIRPTREDKKHAVRMLLADPEWRKWSNNEIGRRCGVTHPTVAGYKAEFLQEERERNKPKPTRSSTSSGGSISSLENFSSDGKEDGQKSQYRDKHGNISEMNTANIGGHNRAPRDDDDGPLMIGPEEDVDELDEELEEVTVADGADETAKVNHQLKKTCKKLWRWADDLGIDAQSIVCQCTKLKRFCKKLGLAPSQALRDLRPKPL